MRKVRIIILFFIVSTFCQDALILKSPVFGIRPSLLIKAVSPTNYVYTINTVPNPLKAAIDYVDRDPSCNITFPPVNVNITITKPDNSTSTFTVINYSDGNIDIPFTGGTIGTYNVVAFIDTYTYPEFNGYATVSFQIEIDNDRDNDGIPDSKDACPDNPEDKDGIYDDDGCPEIDGDSDGIGDESDNCPTSSEDYDGFNDSDGCPEPVNMTLTVTDLFGIVSESVEETEGAFIHFNIDDDNKNTIEDHTDIEVPLEDDLVNISIYLENLDEGIIAIKKDNNNSNIWKSANKGSGNELLVSINEISYDLSVPEQKQEFEYIKGNLWIEGLVYNTTSMITIEYKNTEGEVVSTDKIKFSFIAANCGIRQPTALERTQWVDTNHPDYGTPIFPSLIHCEWSVTAESDFTYNCIGYALNPSDPFWVQPSAIDIDGNGIEINELDNFFDGYGYESTTSSDALITYFSNFHAARYKGSCCGLGKWEMWESKCGPEFRIEHQLIHISGNVYGAPFRYYKTKEK